MRLNAKSAARLTSQSASAIEERGRKEAREKAQQAANAQTAARRWKTQSEKLLQAALDGSGSLKVTTFLVGGPRLIDGGFRIAFVNVNAFEQHVEELRAEEVEKKRKLDLEERERAKARADAASRILSQVEDLKNSFIAAVKENERYKALGATKEMVIKRFLEEIEIYQSEIFEGRSNADALFSRLFDSSLFVYKPIDSLRSNVQKLQNSLHMFEKTRRNLPDRLELEQLRRNDDIDTDDVAQIPTMEDFTAYLSRHECPDLLDAAEWGGYFCVSWPEWNASDVWSGQDLIAAAALSWLSGPLGQRVLEAVESEIQEATQSASSSVQLQMESAEKRWSCESIPYLEMPAPEQIQLILRPLGYNVQLHAKGDEIVLVDISW